MTFFVSACTYSVHLPRLVLSCERVPFMLHFVIYCSLHQSWGEWFPIKMCNFWAPNLFSLYLCMQPSNCHKFRWFRFVWLSSLAECIDYSVILWNKILQQKLLFSHCSPTSSLVSAHISCRTIIYCSSSVLTVCCAEEFMKFYAELTEIHEYLWVWVKCEWKHRF